MLSTRCFDDTDVVGDPSYRQKQAEAMYSFFGSSVQRPRPICTSCRCILKRCTIRNPVFDLGKRSSRYYGEHTPCSYSLALTFAQVDQAAKDFNEYFEEICAFLGEVGVNLDILMQYEALTSHAIRFSNSLCKVFSEFLQLAGEIQSAFRPNASKNRKSITKTSICSEGLVLICGPMCSD